MSAGNYKKNIRPGIEVEIVEKHNQKTRVLTTGLVRRLLTKSTQHPHGIKVMLDTGEIGRVKTIVTIED